MPEIYRKLGHSLYPFRRWLWLLTLAAGATSMLLVFADTQVSQRYLLPALAVTLWLLFAISLAYYAAAAVVSEKPRGFVPAVLWSLRRVWSGIFSLAFLLSTLGLVYVSTLALRMAINS